MHRSMGKKKDRPFGGVSQIRSGIFIRQLREILGSRLTGYPDDARLLASNRSTDGLLDEFEANSRDCVVENALKRSVHHSVGKVNVHVKHAVIARLCSRSLAFELSKSPNFKLGVSGCLDLFDGAGATCFLDELYRPSRLIDQVMLKGVAHLNFRWRVAMRVKNHADGNQNYN
jgi:hypothetical protein